MLLGIVEINLLIYAHPVEDRGELGAETGFADGRGGIGLRVGEDAVGPDLGRAILDGVADLHVRGELAGLRGARARTHQTAFGDTFDGHLGALMAVAGRVDGHAGDGVARVTRPHRIVGPEAVLVVGHAGVESVRIGSRGIELQVGTALGVHPGGQHLLAFVLQGDQVAGSLGHYGGDDAVVQGVGQFVFREGNVPAVARAKQACGSEDRCDETEEWLFHWVMGSGGYQVY